MDTGLSSARGASRVLPTDLFGLDRFRVLDAAGLLKRVGRQDGTRRRSPLRPRRTARAPHETLFPEHQPGFSLSGGTSFLHRRRLILSAPN